MGSYECPPWLGVLWVSLRAHGCPWSPMGALMVGVPMGVPKGPWVLQRSHGCPWGPMDAPPWLGVPRVSLRSPGCPIGWGSHGFFRGPMGVPEGPWVTLWLGVLWVSLWAHGCPWGPMGAPMVGGPMGVPKGPWVPLGSYGCPPPMFGGPLGVPMGPCVSVGSYGCPHGWGSHGCP